MMSDRWRPVAVLALLVAFSACDSSSPSGDGVLRVTGEVREAGQVPSPSLAVDIAAWPAGGAADSAGVFTDAAGRYAADLGPFPDGSVDSVRVRVTQNDCDLSHTTELWQRSVSGQADSLVLPVLSLSHHILPGQFGSGSELCGAIVTPTTSELIGDYTRLALWIDEVTDSVRGRWRANHQASSGDDFGYFSGSFESDRLTLDLRPTQPTPCTGLHLEIPVGGDNGVTLGPGSLSGDGSCAVPSTTVRFFEGAVLSEVLPAGGS